MKAGLIRFLRDRSGVSAIEYGLIAALVGVAIVGGATLVGDELGDLFTGTHAEIAASTSASFGAE